MHLGSIRAPATIALEPYPMPRHVLVSGAAGFIGSHLVDRLLASGSHVTGIDCFDAYYDRGIKEANLSGANGHERFRLLELDLAADDLGEAFDGVDAVVHLAAVPGVRASWGESFELYTRNNVIASQRLLEASRAADLDIFAYVSSASVYGDGATEAVSETFLPAPHSPYGVTKLAAEHLAHLYRKVHGLPTTALRVFSCYGPRERPDKAIQKFLTAVREGRSIEVYGDGSQLRDFTYVGDIVEGILAALEKAPVGEAINLARGAPETLRTVIETIEAITGAQLVASYGDTEPGDVRVTHASIEKARELLGYAPATSLLEGITAQWEHVQGTVGV